MAISLTGVTLVNKGKKILDDINIEIEEKRITAVVGNSGSGKTIFAELMAGLIIPTFGDIQIYDYIINRKKSIRNMSEFRKHIGYSSQSSDNDFFLKTVKEELELVLKNNKYSTEQIDYKIKELCELANIDKEILDRDPLTLCSGEKRLISILSSIAHNPDLIIFDEVTAGLDSANKKIIIDLIKKLKSEYGKTVIVISNDVDSLIKYADNVIVLDNGSIVLSGKKMDVFSNTKVFDKYSIELPSIIKFSKLVNEKKNKKIGYYDDIKDLMKAVYRNV